MYFLCENYSVVLFSWLWLTSFKSLNKWYLHPQKTLWIYENFFDIKFSKMQLKWRLMIKMFVWIKSVLIKMDLIWKSTWKIYFLYIIMNWICESYSTRGLNLRTFCCTSELSSENSGLVSLIIMKISCYLQLMDHNYSGHQMEWQTTQILGDLLPPPKQDSQSSYRPVGIEAGNAFPLCTLSDVVNLVFLISYVVFSDFFSTAGSEGSLLMMGRLAVPNCVCWWSMVCKDRAGAPYFTTLKKTLFYCWKQLMLCHPFQYFFYYSGLIY